MIIQFQIDPETDRVLDWDITINNVSLFTKTQPPKGRYERFFVNDQIALKRALKFPKKINKVTVTAWLRGTQLFSPWQRVKLLFKRDPQTIFEFCKKRKNSFHNGLMELVKSKKSKIDAYFEAPASPYMEERLKVVDMFDPKHQDLPGFSKHPFRDGLRIEKILPEDYRSKISYVQDEEEDE